VARFEAYSFLDKYSEYHQIYIALKVKYKIVFVIDWGTFMWKIMFFRMKNGPRKFQRTITKTFKEYFDTFMKIFIDDFTIYNDMETHLQKFKLCFQKCKEYNINLDLEKCVIMVFTKMILESIILKEGKLFDLKKIQAIVNIIVPRNSQ